MEVRNAISVFAGLIMLYSFLPYAKDIISGKVRPSRSARLMIALLVMVSLLQQTTLGSRWLLAMSIGDGVGAIAILFLALRYGVGGLKRLDVICYITLALDVLLWIITGSAFLALHLSVLADLIAMTPVLVKTWHQPWTETPLFFLLGVVGPLLNILQPASTCMRSFYSRFMLRQSICLKSA